MTPLVSVILCAHNPRPGPLGEVLASLARQAPPAGGWELILVDNASNPPLHTSIDLADLPTARVVQEDRLGLSHARLRGFVEARGALLVFVDDDNVLDADYLRLAAEALAAEPALGAAGGKSIARWEALPPVWFAELGLDLACRDLGEDAQYASWRDVEPADRSYPACAPIGAGLVVRREAFAAYMAAAQDSPTRLSLGRRGTSLASGEDNDIVMTLLEQNWQVAYLPALRLEHIIPAGRLTRDYLARYAYSSAQTWVHVLDVHGIRPWRAISPRTLRLRIARAWLSQRPWTSDAAFVRWRAACGLLAGQAELSR